MWRLSASNSNWWYPDERSSLLNRVAPFKSATRSSNRRHQVFLSLYCLVRFAHVDTYAHPPRAFGDYYDGAHPGRWPVHFLNDVEFFKPFKFLFDVLSNVERYSAVWLLVWALLLGRCVA